MKQQRSGLTYSVKVPRKIFGGNHLGGGIVKASKKHGIVKGSKKTYLKVKENLGHPQMGLSQKLGRKNHFRKIHTKSDQFQVHVH